ncbi:VanZ family protein [Tomitella cavernea]|uniref:VanZ-like domain-containing protein n=1 Tax=Tomitella cavernea TaxID=1387982 RepID=A0ABP9CJB5_9ACTN|nr:VanZ family protein [Tomitella cavernea]
MPLAVLIPVSLVMLFSPGSTVPSGPPHSDKLVHAGLFAALAIAAVVAGAGWRSTAAVLLVYAAVSEVLQGVLPIHRNGDLRDVLADTVGIACGIVLTLVVRRFRVFLGK